MCAVAAFTLTGCYEQPAQNKTEQAKKAADAANSLTFSVFHTLFNTGGESKTITDASGITVSNPKRLTCYLP